MNVTKFMVALFAIATLLSCAAYETGPNLLKNGKLTNPDWRGVPADWQSLILRLGQGKGVVKADDGGILVHFTSPDHMDQARLKQTVQLPLDKVYEFSYEYRSDESDKLQADAALLGTGLFLRAYWQVPSREWVKVRGLFHLPPNVPEKGRVIVLLQNRSMPRLWYRNISLCEAKISPQEIIREMPPLKVHSVTSDDIFIMPDTRAASADFLINEMPDDAMRRFRFEASLLIPGGKAQSCRINGRKIEVPMQHIPVGQSKLLTKMFDRRDNALVANTTVTLERIGALAAGVDLNRITQFKDRRGCSFFPIGLYAGTGWKYSADEIAGQGFNIIHDYGTGNPVALEEFDKARYREDYYRANRKLLADAERLGIYVLMSVPWQIAEDAKKHHLLPLWQNLYKDSPALLAWYVDEMRSIRNTPYEVIRAAYRQIHRNDPSRQWWGYENPDSGLAGSIDTIMIGVTSPSLPKLIKLKLGGDVGIIHVYGQKDFMNNQASDLAYNQYNFVMPIIWGARGIFYFIRDNYTSAKINPEYRELAPRVLNTVKRFSGAAPAIVSNEKPPVWAQARTTGNAEYRFFAKGDKLYLFAGCGANHPAGGTLTLMLPPEKRLHDLLNDRPHNSRTVTFAPGKVLLCEIR